VGGFARNQHPTELAYESRGTDSFPMQVVKVENAMTLKEMPRDPVPGYVKSGLRDMTRDDRVKRQHASENQTD
jgi:hypothetical protein